MNRIRNRARNQKRASKANKPAKPGKVTPMGNGRFKAELNGKVISTLYGSEASAQAAIDKRV